MTILIGADPEVFVTDGNHILPSVGLIGGSKEAPRPTEHGAVQEDNVLAEFNINPAESAFQFTSNINNVLSDLNKVLSPLRTEIISSHEFSMNALFNAGPQALEFGCDPDFNCWTTETNDSPNPATALRTAGGHVHIGYDQPDPDVSLLIVKMCDIFLGIPSLLLDEDTRRRLLYGKAGAFRIKAYGLEYRSLSNFWLKSNKTMEWVFNQSKYCVENRDRLKSILDYIDGEEIQRIINEGDNAKAYEVVAALNINMPEV